MPIAIGLAGTFEFEAFVVLAGFLPAKALAALEPLLTGPPREPVPPSLGARIRRDPVNFIGKTLMTLEAVTADGYLRGVLLAYLGEPSARTQVSLARLLEDLVKLRIARQFRAQPSRSCVELVIRYDRRLSTLRLTSHAVSTGSESPPPKRRRMVAGRTDGAPLWATATLSRILWDHSGVAPSIRYPLPGGRQLTIALGRSGVHEFTALEVMHEHFPVVTTAALVHSLAGSSNGVDSND